MDKPHGKLRAWQKSVDLVVEIYKATSRFPNSELYGLTSLTEIDKVLSGLIKTVR
jgi:hypothetical protein